MAKKQQKNLTIDRKIAAEFKATCEANGEKESHVIEKFMERYVADESLNLYDDIQAPRINELVSRTIRKEIERVIKMNRVLQKDVRAVLSSVPASYKKSLESFETTLEIVLRPELLDSDRNALKLSKDFDLKTDGAEMISKTYMLANSYEKAERLAAAERS
jgi:hypothetical protein